VRVGQALGDCAALFAFQAIEVDCAAVGLHEVLLVAVPCRHQKHFHFLAQAHCILISGVRCSGQGFFRFLASDATVRGAVSGQERFAIINLEVTAD